MQKFSSIHNLLDKSARVHRDATIEGRLQRWSQPPSKTEIEKCERAERMVKEAIAQDPKLSNMNISVFAKGSYASTTNIPADSDVDIGVLHENKFFNEYPQGSGASDFNFIDSTYSFAEFSADVAKAIENKFGKSEVIVDDKCIKVRSNSCRVDADVVPHFVHRRYISMDQYHEGVAILTNSQRIYNWPQQDYDNGVTKNADTNKAYKGLVRILKSICSEMSNVSYESAEYVKSYLLACLAWNVPNRYFEADSYEEILFDSLDFLINMTSSFENVKEWGEVNELKYLFRDAQSWTLTEVNQFLKDAKVFAEGLR